MDFIDSFLSHVGEVFNYNFFKNFLSVFFFPSFGTHITRLLICLILSQRPLRLSSIFSFLSLYSALQQLFPPFYPPAHLSPPLSVILLLVPSRVFLISVIVLFISVCLFFISSMSLVTVLTVVFLSFFPFYFQVLITYLLSLF